MAEDALVGRTLGGVYRVDKRLGAGGIGAVYAASQIRTKRRYAVKVLLPEMALRSSAVERFRREGEALAALGHAGIVQIHDFDTAEDGTQFLVMDLLEGEDLATRLERTGALEWGAALRILEETASALAAAHTLGIVHRDLKPANIFLARRQGSAERATILDFGLAKNIAAMEDVRLTATGAGLGTPLYMSPEQARGNDVDLRTDVYALGCVLYEMLTGSPPFEGPTLTAVIARILTDPPPTLSENTRRALPAGLDEVLRTALAKNPAQRYGSAQALVDAVHRAAVGFAPSANVEPLALTAPPTDGRPDSSSSPGFAETLASLPPPKPRAPIEEASSADSTHQRSEPAGAGLAYGKIAQTRASGDTVRGGRGALWLGLAALAAVLVASGVGVGVYVASQRPRAGAPLERDVPVSTRGAASVPLVRVVAAPAEPQANARAGGTVDAPDVPGGTPPVDGAGGPSPRPQTASGSVGAGPGGTGLRTRVVAVGVRAAPTVLERQAAAEERVVAAQLPVEPAPPSVASVGPNAAAFASARRQMEVQIRQSEALIAELRAALPVPASVREDARAAGRGTRPPSCAAEKRRRIQELSRSDNNTVAAVAQRLDGVLERVCQAFDDWESPPPELREQVRRFASTLDRSERMASEVSTTNQPRADADRVLAAIADARLVFARVPADGARFPCRDPSWSSLRDLGSIDNHWSAAAARNIVTDVDRLCSPTGMSARGLESHARQLGDAAAGAEQNLRSLIATHEDLVVRFRAQAATYAAAAGAP
jgi:serine/threonine-protein kinase